MAALRALKADAPVRLVQMVWEYFCQQVRSGLPSRIGRRPAVQQSV
jgi:hypothetical protein